MKRLFTALAVFCLIGSTTSAASFSDVDQNTSYYKSIITMAEAGVIDGDPEGIFRPDDCVNRVEMLKLLFETTGENTEDLAAGGSYPDIDSSAWCYPYVKKASLKGVVDGYPDGQFKPANCVNRAEALKMAINEFEIDILDLGVGWGWKDVPLEEWYFNFVFTAIGHDLVGLEHVKKGDEMMAGSYFYPAGDLTRKEAAEMLYRMSQHVGIELMIEDIPDFSDTDLGLSFDLPEEWDLIEKATESDHILLSIVGTKFLGSDNGEEGPGRGAYWGDSADLITNADYIRDYCSNEETESCELLTNANGVEYVKAVEEIFGFGGSTVETQYYIYNSSSDFRGVILSTKSLNESGFSAAEADLELIIQSLSFI